MSVLERTDHNYVRIYMEGDPLPTGWEPICDPLVTDELIIVDDVVRVEAHNDPISQKVIEGIGWVILPKVDLETAGSQGLLAGACLLDAEAA